MTPVSLRMPFGFGAVTLTRLPLCTARLEIAAESGRRSVGFAADLLAPKWFEKDPGKSLEEDSENLLSSARAAGDALSGRRGTAFDLWWRLYRDRVPDALAPDGLVRGFGVAICERALIDATCRAAGNAFHVALREGELGFRPGEVHAELEDFELLVDPRRTVFVRHTVGMLDPLTEEDLKEPIGDGFPETLVDDIHRYGLCYFKVKIGGDKDADFERLLRIAAVLQRHAPDYRFTLDANEQYRDLVDLVVLLTRLARDDLGCRMLTRLLFIEQPMPRQLTFDLQTRGELAAVSEIAPVIIDEADCGVDAFRIAAGLGYRGVSIKNCKGVFRALINRGLCEVLDGDLFQSAEDLTNLPVLALQQDLVTLSVLGVEHAERNGYHYFRGLDHLPSPLVLQALEAHPDLYAPTDAGAGVRIEEGRMQIGSLHCVGYGYDGALDMEELCR